MGKEPTHSVQFLDKLIVPPEPLHTTSVLPDQITGEPLVGSRSNSQISRESSVNGKIVFSSKGKSKKAWRELNICPGFQTRGKEFPNTPTKMFIGQKRYDRMPIRGRMKERLWEFFDKKFWHASHEFYLLVIIKFSYNLLCALQMRNGRTKADNLSTHNPFMPTTLIAVLNVATPGECRTRSAFHILIY